MVVNNMLVKKMMVVAVHFVLVRGKLESAEDVFDWCFTLMFF